jgi:glucose/mannose-6-phosphate isomerase
VVLPGYADRDTLVIVTSYSGNTAESLEQYDEALRRGCRIAVVTSGVEAGRTGEKNSHPMDGNLPGNPAGASLGYLSEPFRS